MRVENEAILKSPKATFEEKIIAFQKKEVVDKIIDLPLELVVQGEQND